MRDMESHSLDISCFCARLSVEELDSTQLSFWPRGGPMEILKQPWVVQRQELLSAK